MQILNKTLIILFLLAFTPFAYGQSINVFDGAFVSNMIGDEIDPQWSANGKKLLFQSSGNGYTAICIYNIDLDTIHCISDPKYSIRNAIWHPDGDKVVFDSDNYLYIIDLNTKVIKPLFKRNIQCRNASFSASSRQVYFTGYDDIDKCWEIYSYDFIYDNLNKLTDYNLGCSNAKISSDGRLIVYCRQNPFVGTINVDVINWYGEPVTSFNEFAAKLPTWNSTGFKIFFVSDMDSKNGEIYSIWKNGSHLERITNDTIEIQYFSISPDETKIAISFLSETGLDISIIPFDE